MVEKARAKIKYVVFDSLEHGNVRFSRRAKWLKRTLLSTLILLLTGSFFYGLGVHPRLVSAIRYSGTDVGGPISTNTTWTMAGNPYVVSSDIAVLVGVFLRIEPGVTVLFENGTSMIVDGTLVIQGNFENRTTFTSNSLLPALGDWGSIRARTGGHVAGLEWTTVEYSSGGIAFPADSSYVISDCVFRANGVGISGSNVNVTHCTFEENTNAIDAANAQVVDCDFFENDNAITGSGICAAQNLRVWNNSGNGIQISGPVINCLVHDNGGNGIVGNSITDCLVYKNAGSGAGAYGPVTNCTAFDNGGGGISGGTLSNVSSYGNGGYGVHCDSISNCYIHDNGGNGIEGGFIANCIIEGNGDNGVSLAFGGTIMNSSISENEGYGVFGLMEGVVSQCSIYNNKAGGVQVWAAYGPACYVRQTQICNNSVGIFVSRNTFGMSGFFVPLNVSDCTIRGNLGGGIVTDSVFSTPGGLPDVYLMIARTLIDSNGPFGIRFNSTLVDWRNITQGDVHSLIQDMSDCTITNQTVGAVGAFVSVKGSNITANSQVGLEVLDFPPYWEFHDFENITKINGNNIYGNGLFNIKNHFLFGNDFDATMNWWGTTNTTEIGLFIYDYYKDYNLSRVIYEPYLASPIPEFQSFLILLLFAIATLCVVIACKRKHHSLA